MCHYYNVTDSVVQQRKELNAVKCHFSFKQLRQIPFFFRSYPNVTLSITELYASDPYDGAKDVLKVMQFSTAWVLFSHSF